MLKLFSGAATPRADPVRTEVCSVVVDGWAVDPVLVRVRVRPGLPELAIGSDDRGSRATAARLRLAICAVGLALPSARIAAEFVPAIVPQSYHDLPILLGILAAFDLTDLEQLGDWIVAGALTGNGALLAPPQPLALALHARAHDRGLLTAAAARAAAAAARNPVLAANDLHDLIRQLRGELAIPPQPSCSAPPTQDTASTRGHAVATSVLARVMLGGIGAIKERLSELGGGETDPTDVEAPLLGYVRSLLARGERLRHADANHRSCNRSAFLSPTPVYAFQSRSAVIDP